MKPATYLRWMLRESRGARGRMVYFAACLAVGVAAVVGTAALSHGVEEGFRARSREILGADFTVDARRELPPALDAAIDGIPGAERTLVLEAPTMVAVPEEGGFGKSRLAVVKAVSGRFPLYGEVTTDPPGGLARHLRADTVVVAADLLDSLRLAPGDDLRVAGGMFRIAAAVREDPGRPDFSSLLGARVYLTREGFGRTGLVLFGTRITYRVYVRLPEPLTAAELDGLIARIEDEVPESEWLDFDTHFEVGPSGRRSSRRMEGFVGLVALLSLVVGGIGVAQIVRAWIAGRTPAVAVMRCLGLRPAQILLLSLGHIALLALAGSLAGAAAGLAVPFAARAAVPDLFPRAVLVGFPLAAVARGVGLGVGLAVAFALPPLTAVWRVPPARVLRADAEPLPPNRLAAGAAGLLLLAGVFGAAWVQASEVRFAVWFTGGFVVLLGALWVGARGLMFAAGRVPRGWLNPYLAHGVSALARPGAGTVGAVVALGLGTMVVTGLFVVESRLREGILGQIPDDAPSVFLVDVPTDDWEGVRAALDAAGSRAVVRVPVVSARITAIDGRSVEDLAAEAEAEDRSSRTITREQRLTWARELPADNEIVAGALWSEPDRPEVSVERRYAERIGVEVGSRITFETGGKSVTLDVTSIRDVNWRSFAINFFLVVEPGVLDGTEAVQLAGARVPEGAESALQDRLAGEFPNVTVIRVGPILDKVLALVRRVAAGVRLLGWFTVLAGLAILAGAVSATALRRGREVALLKTLGVTRLGVTMLFLTEYGLGGFVAGAVGAAGALLLSWGYLTFVAEFEVTLPLLVLPAAALACGLLTAVCGVAASARALRIRPIEALR